MSATVFVDTNVFLYALDERDANKQSAARDWKLSLWQTRNGRTSYQVLSEFYVKALRLWPEARAQARAEVQDLFHWNPVVMDHQVLSSAWKLQDRYKLPFSDALIVAAALAAKCRYLLTEDLQADTVIENVKVVSPFQVRPAEIH